jgi:preprotein translocase subunit SecA
MVTSAIGQAQVRVEGYNFDIRKRVLEYDDVVNKQREVIYRQRRELLDREDLSEEYFKILDEQIGKLVDEFLPDQFDRETWDLEALHRQLFTLFPVPGDVTPEIMQGKSLDELEEMLVEAAHQAYDKKSAELGPDLMKRAERLVMLNAIDQHWRRHLTDLDILREGIGLMAIAQRDPLVEYKREAFGMWQSLQEEISLQAIRNIFRVQANIAQPVIRRPNNIQAVRPGAVATSKAEPVRKNAKETLGRNDPCWCGSGKKYKHCHMRADRGLKATE